MDALRQLIGGASGTVRFRRVLSAAAFLALAVTLGLSISKGSESPDPCERHELADRSVDARSAMPGHLDTVGILRRSVPAERDAYDEVLSDELNGASTRRYFGIEDPIGGLLHI